MAYDLPDEVQQQIDDALCAGRKIEAIKHFREATGTGLKEGKEFADARERELQSESPEMFGPITNQKSGCLPMLIFGLLVPGLSGWLILW